jgi:anti-anti-sigma factor
MDSPIRTKGSVVIIDMKGSLNSRDFGLVEQVGQLLASGHKKIVVNLTDVNDMFGDYGMGHLIKAHFECKSLGAELIFLNPRREFHKVLKETKMDYVFAAYSEESEALHRVQE